MVSDKDIQAANALINDATGPGVAVFVGGTSGVGKYTIRALVATGTSVRIYLVGRRSSQERMHAFIQELHDINPKAEVIWTEGEVTLLAETKRICEIIKSKESHVDLLFHSAGYAPFDGREETSEGIEIAQSLEYYSRILFILQLLPLLEKAENPRVVGVLAGGFERANAINLDDLDLKKPGNFSGFKAHAQYIASNTTALEKLANDNPNVTFIHSCPGWVNTGNVRRSLNVNSLWGWVVRLVLEPLMALFSIPDDVSGQRNLFLSTSAAFGGRGVPWQGKPGINSLERRANGLFLVSHKCDCTPNARVVSLLREKAQGKLWDHTYKVLEPYL